MGFWSWLSCARLYAENPHSCKYTKNAWPPLLIFAGACHGHRTCTVTKTCDKCEYVRRPCDGVFALDLSFHSVAVGFAILCFQRWILVTVAFIGIWGNFPCLFYIFTNTTLNRFGFGMSTVGTAVFDCISWLVPVATDSSVFIRSNIVWNRWKSTLKARSIRLSLNLKERKC